MWGIDTGGLCRMVQTNLPNFITWARAVILFAFVRLMVNMLLSILDAHLRVVLDAHARFECRGHLLFQVRRQ